MSDYIIETHDLKKHYGPFQALHGLALHVRAGLFTASSGQMGQARPRPCAS